ncbi:hypothetical protein [Risungbinella massiliensis]|uniref:hypothetical protein n=1 Tax=Risungbinella massiliensis TaxID=1329796 RepID=UPI0005CBDC72|nr:hypothetical protein [Risungbinella massiliensis]
MLYLGKKDQAIPYFLKAAEDMERLIMIFTEKKNLEQMYRCKHIQANYFRLAEDNEKSRQLLQELLPAYISLYEQIYEKNDEQGITVVSRLTDCLFFIEDYEKSIYYGKKVRHWFPISLGYAEGILLNDENRIVYTLNYVMKDIESQKSQPYDTGSETSLWDWVDIGRRLLGLPSKLDMLHLEENI